MLFFSHLLLLFIKCYQLNSTAASSSMKEETEEHPSDDKNENIENYLGVDAASLVETSFYAHYFETHKEETHPFVAHFALAKCKHPLTQSVEHWLSVQFNSKFDGP